MPSEIKEILSGFVKAYAAVLLFLLFLLFIVWLSILLLGQNNLVELDAERLIELEIREIGSNP